MKPVLLLAVGVTLGVAVTHWQRPVAWIMTCIPPATHPDCAPRFRTWHHGEVAAEGTFTLGGAGCPHTW